MAEFTYPTNAEIREINQDLLPKLAGERPIFNYIPMREPDTYLVAWEQEDNYIGLQQVRGLNGEPPKVAKVGMKRYQMQPGVYGEFLPIDETELTVRRQYGTWATPINIADLVVKAQRQLLERRLDRIEQIAWNLVTTGTFSVAGIAGAVLHTDSYTVQTFTATVPWSTVATATPLADLRAVQVLARGHSIRFDQSSKVWINQITVNNVLSNTNAADLYGRRVAGLATVNSLNQLNELLTMDGLPNLAVYDDGYMNDSNVFVPFIANTTGVAIGRRTDGAPIGEYQMVRNANNPDLRPGPYMKVIDLGENHVPRSIQVHDGHSGGPAILFPSAIVKLSNL